MNRTRLAAIMFTDIVGYTSAMGEDTAAALEMVQKSREIQKPLVEKYRGRWIKEMGDGTMAQFESAQDAVQCALEIQKCAKSGFGGLLRIGIHLGDITFTDNDIYGEGVNVASRLESIAEPGSIYISDSVHQAIKGRKGIHARYLGEKKLKNVREPVRTYSVGTEEMTGSSVSRSKYFFSAKMKYVLAIAIFFLIVLVFLWQSDRNIFTGNRLNPTLAVLPITLSGNNPDDAYFGEGLTMELINNLGKIKSLSVINFPTSIQYMGFSQPAKTAISDLENVDYFVLGSANKLGNAIEMDIHLVNNGNDTIWHDTYSWDIANTPGMAGTIASEITGAIKIKMGKSETSRLKDIEPVDPEVYELLLKGLTRISSYNPEGFFQGMSYLQEAVDKNPANSYAWAGLAEGYVYMGHSPSPPPDAWHNAKAAAIRAIQLDSTNALAWASLAHTKTYFEWDYEGAEIAYHKANELNPNLAMNHYHYAWHLDLFDRVDEAIVEHRKAQRLDPFFPAHTAWLAWLLEKAGRPEEGIREARKSLKIVKDFPLGYFNIGHIYLKQGNYDSTVYYMRKAADLQPSFRYMGLGRAYLESGQIEKGMEFIRELENQPLDSYNALNLAMLYARIDSVDKFFHYINYEPAHAFTPWTRVNETNPLILQDLRFKLLMDKMNLPMPGI